MKPFDLWKKMILAKVYTKVVVTTRVNVVYAVGQLKDDEYTELIRLVEQTYVEDVA